MIEVTAILKGYGSDAAAADTPEAANTAARTLADDIRAHVGTDEKIACDFRVNGAKIRRVWF